ncbi:MAG: protein kinase [Phycisphaerae bacterium]
MSQTRYGDPPSRVETVFHSAVELPLDGREAFLNAQCAGDTVLRRRVDRLLAAHDRGLDTFLETPPITAMSDDAERLPARIGPYDVLAKLGEGGCGMVYLARQTRPVRRDVAIKVMHTGMNTRQAEARFDAERQVLAMLDHPHIATVYDAGVTENRQPYFVMERVNGLPLQDYCAREALDTRAGAAVHLDLPCHRTRPPAWDHPPGLETVEHPGDHD